MEYEDTTEAELEDWLLQQEASYLAEFDQSEGDNY
jgi:hypothetical protein